MKMQNFQTKLPNQEPILRQMEWHTQNRPITKNEVMPLISFFKM